MCPLPGSNTRLAGKILTFSGRTGKVLGWQEAPDHRESYYSPVLYRRRDASDFVLFGTGGETHGGSLWLITLGDLLKGQILKVRKVNSQGHKEQVKRQTIKVRNNRSKSPTFIDRTVQRQILKVRNNRFQRSFLKARKNKSKVYYQGQIHQA